MSDSPPSNVKIYDRPQGTKPSLIMIVVVLLIVLGVGLFVYRSMHHPTTTTTTTQPAANGQNTEMRSNK